MEDREKLIVETLKEKGREGLKEFEEPYNDFIKRIIIKFAKRGYNIYLFSFSEFEKDGEAIQKIISMVPEEYKDKIKVEIFRKDIEKYLETYSKMEYMVCGRFHSMILSILFEQKIYNITYSQKQENVINEAKLFKRYQPINQMSFDTILRTYYFKKASKIKLKRITKESEGQFRNLDNWLETKEQEK